VVIRDQVPQRARHEQMFLQTVLLPQHRRDSTKEFGGAILPNPIHFAQWAEGGFFNSPTAAYNRLYRQYKEQHKVKFNDHLETDRAGYKEAHAKLKRLARVVKGGKSKVAERARLRHSRVEVVYQRHQRLLLGKKVVSTADMTNAFESALKID